MVASGFGRKTRHAAVLMFRSLGERDGDGELGVDSDWERCALGGRWG